MTDEELRRLAVAGANSAAAAQGDLEDIRGEMEGRAAGGGTTRPDQALLADAEGAVKRLDEAREKVGTIVAVLKERGQTHRLPRKPGDPEPAGGDPPPDTDPGPPEC